VLDRLFRLDGAVAVLPGGAGGIGSAMAEGLAAYGANIVLAGRSLEHAEESAEPIRKLGVEVMTHVVEVTDPESVNRLVDAVVERFGRLDILINLAGTNFEAPAEEFPYEEWKRVVDLNLTGTFLCCQAAGRVMIRQQRGKIINISSVRSVLGIRRGYAAYCPSKAGVNLLTKQLATEWAKYNINVNCIAPTFIKTPLVAPMLADETFYNGLVNRIPLGRVGEPADLVGAALFFSSAASDFVTGQVLLVDGGVTATQ